MGLLQGMGCTAGSLGLPWVEIGIASRMTSCRVSGLLVYLAAGASAPVTDINYPYRPPNHVRTCSRVLGKSPVKWSGVPDGVIGNSR